MLRCDFFFWFLSPWLFLVQVLFEFFPYIEEGVGLKFTA